MFESSFFVNMNKRKDKLKYLDDQISALEEMNISYEEKLQMIAQQLSEVESYIVEQAEENLPANIEENKSFVSKFFDRITKIFDFGKKRQKELEEKLLNEKLLKEKIIEQKKTELSELELEKGQIEELQTLNNAELTKMKDSRKNYETPKFIKEIQGIYVVTDGDVPYTPFEEEQKQAISKREMEILKYNDIYQEFGIKQKDKDSFIIYLSKELPKNGEIRSEYLIEKQDGTMNKTRSVILEYYGVNREIDINDGKRGIQYGINSLEKNFENRDSDYIIIDKLNSLPNEMNSGFSRNEKVRLTDENMVIAPLEKLEEVLEKEPDQAKKIIYYHGDANQCIINLLKMYQKENDLKKIDPKYLSRENRKRESVRNTMVLRDCCIEYMRDRDGQIPSMLRFNLNETATLVDMMQQNRSKFSCSENDIIQKSGIKKMGKERYAFSEYIGVLDKLDMPQEIEELDEVYDKILQNKAKYRKKDNKKIMELTKYDKFSKEDNTITFEELYKFENFEGIRNVSKVIPDDITMIEKKDEIEILRGDDRYNISKKIKAGNILNEMVNRDRNLDLTLGFNNATLLKKKKEQEKEKAKESLGNNKKRDFEDIDEDILEI